MGKNKHTNIDVIEELDKMEYDLTEDKKQFLRKFLYSNIGWLSTTRGFQRDVLQECASVAESATIEEIKIIFNYPSHCWWGVMEIIQDKKIPTDIAKVILNPEFNDQQMSVLHDAVKDGLSIEAIKLIANPKINYKKMISLKNSFEEEIPVQVMELIANPVLSESRMTQIFYSYFYEKKPIEIITLMANSTFNDEQVLLISQDVDKGLTLEQIKTYANPEFDEIRFKEERKKVMAQLPYSQAYDIIECNLSITSGFIYDGEYDSTYYINVEKPYISFRIERSFDYICDCNSDTNYAYMDMRINYNEISEEVLEIILEFIRNFAASDEEDLQKFKNKIESLCNDTYIRVGIDKTHK